MTEPKTIAMTNTTRLIAGERVDRDLARDIVSAANRHGESPGTVMCGQARVNDVLAALRAAHRTAGPAHAATGKSSLTAIAVDTGPATWLFHVDPPASIGEYVEQLAGELPEGGEATLLATPADFARARTAAGDQAEALAVDELQGYVEWAGCRHQALVGFLQGTLAEECGNCDNCLQPPPNLLGADDASRAVQAVRLTGERFGVAHLVRVLRGERNETASQHGHERLAVWGRGAQLSRAQWDAVFRQLLAAGILKADAQGSVVLTPLSEAVASGDRTVRFARHAELPDAPMPKRRGAPASRASTTAPRTAAARSTRAPGSGRSARSSEEAKRALYRWRAAFAADRDIPAIRVLTDPDITALVVRRPASMEDLRRIVTPSRCDAYGEAILAAVADLG